MVQTSLQPAEYKHDLGNGLYLNALSLDPSLTKDDLEAIVKKEQEKQRPDLGKVSLAMDKIGDFSSFDELGVEILPEPYRVPEQLGIYREAFGNKMDASRRIGAPYPKNGEVAMIVGEVRLPLTICQGGYYDFKATEPQAVPTKLEGELKNAPYILRNLQSQDELFKLIGINQGNLLNPTLETFARLADSYQKIKGVYPEGKTIRDLFKEWDIPETRRARYLGCAHIMFTDNGKEWLTVQRAKNLGVAADCISSPGSTPDPKLNPKFQLGSFMKRHLNQEMDEEFRLESEEFNISGFSFYDDRDSMPFIAVRITTPLKTREIVERCFGDKEVLREHYVLYSAPIEAIGKTLESVSMFPSIAYVMNNLR